VKFSFLAAADTRYRNPKAAFSVNMHMISYLGSGQAVLIIVKAPTDFKRLVMQHIGIYLTLSKIICIMRQLKAGRKEP